MIRKIRIAKMEMGGNEGVKVQVDGRSGLATSGFHPMIDGNTTVEFDDGCVDLIRPVVLEPAIVPMIMACPQCHERHVDRGEFATRAHHTHACQRCGFCWRPAVVPTVGVQFLPGFKDADEDQE